MGLVGTALAEEGLWRAGNQEATSLLRCAGEGRKLDSSTRPTLPLVRPATALRCIVAFMVLMVEVGLHLPLKDDKLDKRANGRHRGR